MVRDEVWQLRDEVWQLMQRVGDVGVNTGERCPKGHYLKQHVGKRASFERFCPASGVHNLAGVCCFYSGFRAFSLGAPIGPSSHPHFFDRKRFTLLSLLAKELRRHMERSFRHHDAPPPNGINLSFWKLQAALCFSVFPGKKLSEYIAYLLHARKRVRGAQLR